LRIRRRVCRELVDEYIQAVRERHSEEFGDSWVSADLVVLEDVDFLVDMPALQEELHLHVVERALAAGRQVIMTSSVPLSRLHVFNQKLPRRRRRVIRLPKPSLETRAAWALARAEGLLSQAEVEDAARVADNFYSLGGEVQTRLARLRFQG
jgi:chromosomal replication initiator protein